MDGHDEEKDGVVGFATAPDLSEDAAATSDMSAASTVSTAPDMVAASAAPNPPDAAPVPATSDSVGEVSSNLDAEAQSGGIFSTPDLTIATENVPQTAANLDTANAVPHVNQTNQAKVSSLFHRHKPSQRSTSDATADSNVVGATTNIDDVANSASTIDAANPLQLHSANTQLAPAHTQFNVVASRPVNEGDVVLSKKQHGLGKTVIIAMIAAMIIGGGVALGFLLGSAGRNTVSELTLQDKYQNFVNYLSDSPDGNYKYSSNMLINSSNANNDNLNDSSASDASANSIPFMLVAANILNDTDAVAYFAELENRYQMFVSGAIEQNNADLTSAINNITQVFPVLAAVSQLELANTQLIYYIATDNQEAAQKYVDQLSSVDTSNIDADNLLVLLEQYLDNASSLYQIYNQSGCLLPNSVNASCIIGLTNNIASSLRLDNESIQISIADQSFRLFEKLEQILNYVKTIIVGDA